MGFKYDIKIWDKKSKDYGKTYDLEAKNREIIIQRLTKLNKNLPIRLIEIGCGNGLILQKISLPNSIIVGLDISLEMLKVAQTKIPYPIYLIKGITQKLPFKENKFDVILCINLLVNLEGIEDVRLTIEKIARIAKENALIFIEYRNKLNPGMSYQCYKKKKRKIPHPYNAYSIFQIKKILKENNLMIKERIPVFPDKSSSKLKGILYSLYSLFIYNKLFSPCIILKVSPKPKKDAL